MDLQNKKYVMANIKIPIEIKENNECETLMDLLNVDFTPIDILPEVITDKKLQQEIKDKLYVFLSNIFLNNKEQDEKKVENEKKVEEQNNETSNAILMYINTEELHKKKKPLNTTFKKKHQKSCKKYTCKNYEEFDNNGR